MDIKPYLKYYLGCQYKLTGYPANVTFDLTSFTLNAHSKVSLSDVVPILKRLSDITEEDATAVCRLSPYCKYPNDIEIVDVAKTHIHFIDGQECSGDGWSETSDIHVCFVELNAEQFHYLISKGYWLFDPSAFDKGLIIDAKTIS